MRKVAALVIGVALAFGAGAFVGAQDGASKPACCKHVAECCKKDTPNPASCCTKH
jgi:hypothetical protein